MTGQTQLVTAAERMTVDQRNKRLATGLQAPVHGDRSSFAQGQRRRNRLRTGHHAQDVVQIGARHE